MRKRMRVLVTAMVAALVAGLYAAAAVAEPIEAEPAGEITSTSLGSLTFRASIVETSCPMTFDGTFTESIEDTTGEDVFSFSEGSVGGCSTGSARLLFGSAWDAVLVEEVNPESEVVNVELSDVAISVTVGVTCLYVGSITLAVGIDTEQEPVVTELVTVVGGSLVKSSGSIFCPTSGEVVGTIALEPQQALGWCPPWFFVAGQLPYRGEIIADRPTIAVRCQLRIRSIRAEAGAAFRVEDPNRLSGRLVRPGAYFYQVEGNRAGAFEIIDNITIETSKGNVVSRVSWRNP